MYFQLHATQLQKCIEYNELSGISINPLKPTVAIWVQL